MDIKTFIISTDIEFQYAINQYFNISAVNTFLFENYLSSYLEDGGGRYDEDYGQQVQIFLMPAFMYRPFGTRLKGMYASIYPTIGWTYASTKYLDDTFTHLGFGLLSGYQLILKNGFTIQLGGGISKTWIIPFQNNRGKYRAEDEWHFFNLPLDFRLVFRLGYSLQHGPEGADAPKSASSTVSGYEEPVTLVDFRAASYRKNRDKWDSANLRSTAVCKVKNRLIGDFLRVSPISATQRSGLLILLTLFIYLVQHYGRKPLKLRREQPFVRSIIPLQKVIKSCPGGFVFPLFIEDKSDFIFRRTDHLYIIGKSFQNKIIILYGKLVMVLIRSFLSPLDQFRGGSLIRNFRAGQTAGKHDRQNTNKK
jgi:hypothetical protein